MRVLKAAAIIGGILTVAILTSYWYFGSKQETAEMGEAARQSAPGQFVALGNGVTHYVEMGPTDGPAVLFIHGGGVTGMEVWNKNASSFADHGYRVLLYDLYGRGYSDRLSADYTPELLSRQMDELLEAIDFPDSLSIVSMSLGSIVALDYASRHPSTVRHLVLIAPAAAGNFKPNIFLRVPLVSSLLLTLYWYPRSVENQRREFVDQAVFEEYAPRLNYFMNFRGYKHVNHSTWTNTLNQNKLDLLRVLPSGIVLLVYGSLDPYFPDQNVPLYRQFYPSLDAVEIDSTGHIPHLEKPAEINRAILDFLAL